MKITVYLVCSLSMDYSHIKFTIDVLTAVLNKKTGEREILNTKKKKSFFNRLLLLIFYRKENIDTDIA